MDNLITIDELVNWYCEEKGIVLWKDIQGFEGFYQVSNVGGMIRSLDTYVNCGYNSKRLCRGRTLKTHKDKDGYERVTLKKQNLVSGFAVARLVAEAFIPNPHNYPQVNHIDECKTSNNAANLEWCDAKYNSTYGKVRTQKLKSKRNHRTINQYSIDGIFMSSYRSVNNAAKVLGISRTSIRRVLLNERKTAGGYIWKYNK